MTKERILKNVEKVIDEFMFCEESIKPGDPTCRSIFTAMWWKLCKDILKMKKV